VRDARELRAAHPRKDRPLRGHTVEGPEYETIYSYGGQTGVDNLDSIIAADRLSDELGLDTMSAGVAIGFAMELFERGILTTARHGRAGAQVRQPRSHDRAYTEDGFFARVLERFLPTE